MTPTPNISLSRFMLIYPEYLRRLPEQKRLDLFRDLSGFSFLIYDGSKGAYWRPLSRGYTNDKAEAGVYSLSSAYDEVKSIGPEKKITIRLSDPNRSEPVSETKNEPLPPDRAPKGVVSIRRDICNSIGPNGGPCSDLTNTKGVATRAIKEALGEEYDPVPVPGGRFCGLCKCYLPVKRAILFFHCPRGFWVLLIAAILSSCSYDYEGNITGRGLDRAYRYYERRHLKKERAKARDLYSLARAFYRDNGIPVDSLYEDLARESSYYR